MQLNGIGGSTTHKKLNSVLYNDKLNMMCSEKNEHSKHYFGFSKTPNPINGNGMGAGNNYIEINNGVKYENYRNYGNNSNLNEIMMQYEYLKRESDNYVNQTVDKLSFASPTSLRIININGK